MINRYLTNSRVNNTFVDIRPVAGSLTDIRGRKAKAHILKEVVELCEIIYQEGTPCRDHPEIIAITFGDLFNIYTHINDKCVGLLLRARKQKYVDFEGECLFQVNIQSFHYRAHASYHFSEFPLIVTVV